MKFLTLTATVSLLAVGAAAQAVTIANWTFETSVPVTAGPHVAEAGVNAATSFATGFHSSTAAVYSNPAGNGSAESFSSNNWSAGDYYQFAFSLSGYEAATITFDQAASGTGPKDFNLQISTDGVNFTNVVSNYAVATNGLAPLLSWNGVDYRTGYTIGAVTLGATTDNAANVYVRLTSNEQTAAAGTNRIDNVVIEATDAVPEPATMAILGLGVAALARRKRK